jgi:taurine dioxygenase
MTVDVIESGQACGASITGVDISKPLSEEAIAEIRAIWLKNRVVAFPGQTLDDDQLEQFTLQFGKFGVDPFIAPIEDHPHVISLERSADETSSIFADAWHADWSFQAVPPSATCLYSIVVPPEGGDTLFINQVKALAEMPAELRSRLEGKQALHTAAGAYSPDGLYGENDKDSNRAMKIIVSKDAHEIQQHPIIQRHEETGEETLYGCLGYIIGFEGMDKEDSDQLLVDLYMWQTREEFQYRHKWQPGTLVMWDNRSVLHCATGGYEGHARKLHRTTIAGLTAA